MAIWSLAKKECRLLLRDWRAALLLLAMPLVFILVLGLLLGESFGQKPDDRVRVLIVDLDAPQTDGERPPRGLTGKTWAEEVRNDLKDTAGIRLERLGSREEAERLVREHKQAAVLILDPDFSARVRRCSFLADGINPFHRDGVLLDRVGAELLKDDARQPVQAAVIEQVAQVSLLRVLLPYMIGKAFDRLSETEFIELLGKKVNLPVPSKYRLLIGKSKLSLHELMAMAAEGKPAREEEYRQKVGAGVQEALRDQFRNYDLTGKTWEKLTRSKDPRQAQGNESSYVSKEGNGLLHRGAARYQLLVPSYTVMFSFFLVMTVGWLFVAERRQGTLKRLRAAPITRGAILAGKLVPCFLLSLAQGVLLLLAGKAVFGMRWGPDAWPLWQQVVWLLPVVVATSVAATGLSLLIAALARTEVQVALYGAVPVLVLALVGGCVLPREMMPEQTQWLTLLTPQGWALEAYRELLVPVGNYLPDARLVWTSCGALAGFGALFTVLAWWLLPRD
jgi:ABC-type multidrug transport system permease subunit